MMRLSDFYSPIRDQKARRRRTEQIENEGKSSTVCITFIPKYERKASSHSLFSSTELQEAGTCLIHVNFHLNRRQLPVLCRTDLILGIVRVPSPDHLQTSTLSASTPRNEPLEDRRSKKNVFTSVS